MKKETSRRRVVITGYGMVTCLGEDTESTFQRASEGLSGIDYLTSFDTTGLPCRIGGEVKDEWLREDQGPSGHRYYKFSCRGLRLMRKAANEAALRSDLDHVNQRDRIGVSLGFHGDNPSVEDLRFLHRFFDGQGSWDMRRLMDEGGYPSLAFLRRKPDVATSILSKLFDCRGPNLTIASACAAGSQAIGEACRMIRDGRADVMVAGGAESTLNFVGFTGFVLIRALCDRYTTPQTASRPFDRKRSGFVMSEGAAAVVLEELHHAQERKAPIFGELLGYGASADAYRITDTHPRGLGAVIAMRAALDDAGLGPEDVDYVNAHGTSTTQNDLTETAAIKQVFGDRARSVPVSSNKSMLGHAIAAAGPIEMILTLVGIGRSLVLPTINYRHPDPKCDLDYVPNEARAQAHRTALSNSFGFGGQNASLCLGRWNG